jgi:hypothetical protein
MKNSVSLILGLVVILILLSCSHNKKPDQLKHMAGDVVNFNPENYSGSQPISQMSKDLEQSADKIISLDKSNMAESLETAKEYSKAYIIIENHTFIKINDLTDCKKSTTWNALMPKGTSLVQKSGDFEKKTDYINYLIGMPDNQSRKMYLFK